MKDPLKALVTAPIGQGPLDGADRQAQGANPVCGDKLRFLLRREPGDGLTLRFLATACPATIAVASLAVQIYSGQPRPEGPPFAALRQRIQALGGLSPFEGHALVLVEEVLAEVFAAKST